MSKSTGHSTGFFGVIANPQSYLNIVYLLLAFPLGTFYFVFLVTGLSLGLGLSVTVIGLPLLALVLGGSRVLCRFERGLVAALLKESIPPSVHRPATKGLWSRLKALLTDRTTWTGTFYLLLEFPLGVAAFTIVVALLSVALAQIGAPIIYAYADIDLFIWYVDTLHEAFALSVIGVVWLFLSMHVINGLAFIMGRIARALLSKPAPDENRPGHSQHPD